MARVGPELAEELTPRERDVLELLRLGLTNAEIARRLEISADGAKYHVSEIISKLGVRTRYEASAWPERPPWWLGVAAPVGLLLRELRGSAIAMVLTGVAGLAVAVAIGALVWGLVRTDGSDEPQSVVPTTVIATVEPIVLGEGLPAGVDWSPGGGTVTYIVGGQLFRADAPAFEPELLLPAGGEYGTSIREPRWSPDGTRIAFVGTHVWEENGETFNFDTIWLVRADGTGLRDLMPDRNSKLSTTDGTGPHFQGWLDDNTLAFDDHCGVPCQVAYVLNVTTGRLLNAANLKDATGNLQPLDDVFGTSYHYSPDRRWLAADGLADIAVYDRDEHIRTAIESPPGTHWSSRVLAWAPDSSAFLYATNDGSDPLIPPDLYSYGVPEHEMRLIAHEAWDGTWSPDGSTIAYVTHQTAQQPCDGAFECIVVIDAATGNDRFRTPGSDPTARPFLLDNDRLLRATKGGDLWLSTVSESTMIFDGVSVFAWGLSPDRDAVAVSELGRLVLVPIP